MNFIIELLVEAGVVMFIAYILPQVRIKSFGTALWVAFLVAILDFTLGALLRLPLNLVTFFLLSFVVRLVVVAIIIKVVDKLVENFEVKGFWPALIIAIGLLIADSLLNRKEVEEHYYNDNTIHTASLKTWNI